jgi:hypothetical protein
VVRKREDIPPGIVGRPCGGCTSPLFLLWVMRRMCVATILGPVRDSRGLLALLLLSGGSGITVTAGREHGVFKLLPDLPHRQDSEIRPGGPLPIDYAVE